LIQIFHQPSLGSSDTLNSKIRFEKEAAHCGITVDAYHTDNGIFTKAQFREALSQSDQAHTVSGVGAHHQNGSAERAIKTIQDMSRAMLIHLSVHWPDEYHVDLWPFAMDYAVWLYNHTPQRDSGLAPMEIFCSIRLNCEYLRRAKVFGCPSYVLDPKLQDGNKIPKWNPRARIGQFLGFSKLHSSSVGLIRNLRTNHVSAQFHVIHDQTYSTVYGGLQARPKEDLNPEQFQIFLKSKWKSDEHVHALDEWDTAIDGPLPDKAPHWDADELVPQPTPPRPSMALPPERSQLRPTPVLTHVPTPTLKPSTPLRQVAPPSVRFQPQPSTPSIVVDGGNNQDEEISDGNVDVEDSNTSHVVETVATVSELTHVENEPTQEQPQPKATPTLRRSTRVRRAPDRFKNDFIFTASVMSHLFLNLCEPTRAAMQIDWNTKGNCYLSRLFDDLIKHDTCPISNEVLEIHPMSLHVRLMDDKSDDPTFNEVQKGDSKELGYWYDAIDAELEALHEKHCFDLVDKSEAEGRQIVDSTWVFKRKRRPDGSLLKYKARLCIRGDQMYEGLKEGETAKETSGYAPVIDWGTLRLILNLKMQHDMLSTQVDFKNAFVQAALDRPMYMNLPPGLNGLPQYQDKVLRLGRSLYGHRYAAKLFYELIRGVLVGKLGFKVSPHDHCLFLRKDCIIVTWVDDAIILTKPNDLDKADKLIDEIRAHGLDLGKQSTEGLAEYLGINIKKLDDGSMELTQRGLIDRIIEGMGLQDANSKFTPVTDTLGKCKDKPIFNERFNYRSIIGMLMYLGNTTRPDISFAINQCARFSHDPRETHATALKRIGCYLKATRDRGIIWQKGTDIPTLDCWVDADFAGLYSKEDHDDPTSVRSRTGFVIALGGNVVVWQSKLQTEIALSTMSSEYIAMSTAMRSLIHLRNVHHEVVKELDLPWTKESLISTVFEDNQSCIILATNDPPRHTPQSRTIAVKYHWFREQLHKDAIRVEKIDGKIQRANILTKPLSRYQFEAERKLLIGW